MAADETLASEPVSHEAHHGDQRSHWPMKLLKWLAIVLAVLLALVAAILLGINTAPGKRFVARQVEALEFQNGMKIGVGRIDGSLYGKLTVRDFTLSDTRGVFLRSPALAADWRPFKFIRGHIDIKSLAARTLTLERVPQFKAVAPSDEPLLPDYDIDIDRLQVAQFIAEAPVSGERRIGTLSGSAHIADRRAQVALKGATIGGAAAAGSDRIDLVLDAVPEKNRLDLDLKLDAPANGTIAALAGLTKPLNLRLNGRGDWASWNGKLDANLEGAPFARLALTARDGTFGLRGPTQVARLLTGPTAALLGPTTTLDLTAAFKDRKATLGGTISSDAFNLATNGGIDLADNTFDQLKLAFVLLKPGALAPNLAGRNLRALLTLDGAFRTPRAAYEINAAQLAMNDMGLENLRASGAATVNPDRILVPISARIGRITGLDTVAGGQLANVRLDGDLAIQGPRILSDNMRLRSDRIDAGLILVADTSTGLYTGAVDGRIDDYRIESVGLFDIVTDIDLKTVPTGFALAGTVKVRSTKLFNESVRGFLGGNAIASSNVAYGPDGTARFSNLRLNAPLLRITNGSGSYSAAGQIQFAANAVSSQYGPVGVQVAGTISNPQATIRAARPGFGVGLANLTAKIRGDRGGYRIDATGQTDYGAFNADVSLAMGRGPLALTINRGSNFAGIGVVGQVRQSAAGPFVGQLDARGQGLGGVVRLGAAGRYQQAIINLRANNTVLPGPANLAIGSAIVDARVVLYDTPEVVADAQLAQTTIGGFNLTAARVIVDYRGGRGHAQVLAEGVSGAPFRVAANAEFQPDLWRAQLQGRVRGIAFRTTSPARIIPRRASYELLPTRIDFGQGNIRLAGTYGNGLRIESRLDRLDMELANAFVPGLGLGGAATGSLDFEQASANAFPRADARLSIAGFTRTTAVSVSQPVDINFVGKLLPNGGEARAVMRRRGSVIGRMVASLQPLSPGAGPWTTRVLAAPLSGGIRYNGPADTLFSFAGQPDQRLSGPIGLAADFSGRVQRPTLNGIIRANNLTYENQTYGTRLSNLAIAGRFDADRLEIERLTATAGNGTVSAQGYVSLASAAGYPMDLQATLENARLARSDALSATATGTLRLTKAAGQTALLSGRIQLPETRYQVIRQGAAQVPELTGVRFKPPLGRPRTTGDEPSTPSAGLFQLVRLDLQLSAPEELYVSGMGLESEWSADFTVSGTSAEPRLSGEVELIRGTLGFAGRSFKLTEGRVQFTGGRTIDPVLNLVATEDIEEVTVNVNVTGRAYNPQITFSSTPGLPQDEIMARILFGSSIGNLSAIQGIQLAASLNSLRGSGGGGLNPLGKLRSATGIDRLRILGADQATGRGTALAAGQYITDDIYLEIVTDARGFTATQLEIALTKALSVLSQAGGSGVTNVNVQYKKTY